jgi:uncharacterized protein YheU (UPF0270 family)
MSIKGFNNQKGFGRSEFVTVQSAGSDKKGINTAQMYLFDIAGGVTTPISAVTQTLDKKIIYVDFGGAHNARLGDVLRFVTGGLQYLEFEIIELQSANIVGIWNMAPAIPVVADEVKVCRWVTAKSDGEGSLQVSQGPVQYTRDAILSTVNEDTVTPANNRPLPAGMYILKDGIAYPVGIDTVTPANTVSVPVRLESATGPINITAGDLNVQLSDAGANFDATRIGDGSGIYLKINADGSINVADAAALTQLQALVAKDFATSAKQDLAKAVLDNILTAIGTTNGKDFATSAKQDLAKAVLDNILTAIGTTNGKDFSTSAKQDLAKAVLDNILTAIGTTNGKDFSTSAKQDLAKAVLDNILTAIGVTNGKDFATQTTLAALLAKFGSLGQKASAGSAPVVLSTEQETILSSLATKLDTLIASNANRVMDSIVNVTATTTPIAPPAGAKGFIIQNSTNSNGALRFGLSSATVDATHGYFLDLGQSTSYIDGVGTLKVFDVGGSGLDAAIIWFK